MILTLAGIFVKVSIPGDDPEAADRYWGYLFWATPIAIPVLLDAIPHSFSKNAQELGSKLIYTVVLVVCFTSILGRLISLGGGTFSGAPGRWEPKQYLCVQEFQKKYPEYEITDGFATYWNAKTITAPSRFAVEIHPIIDRLQRRDWISNPKRFRKRADFFFLETTESGFDVLISPLNKRNPQPKVKFECPQGPWEIWYYGKNGARI